MTSKKMNDSSSQTDDHVHAFNRVDHVRLRPGMYFGQYGVHGVVSELLDTLVSQMRQGLCTALKVTVVDPHTVHIWHTGLPLPIAKSDDTGESLLEIILTHVGERPIKPQNPFATFTMGLAVVNAACRDFHVQVLHDHHVWEIRYQKGRKMTELTQCNETFAEGWTTHFALTVDEDIFSEDIRNAKVGWSALKPRLSDLAYLCPSVTIDFENRLTGDQCRFCMRSGVKGYLEHENRYNAILHAPFLFQMAFQGEGNDPAFELDAALQFIDQPDPLIRSFVNSFKVLGHGTHVDGCIRAVTDALVGHSTIIDRGDIPYILQHLTMVVNLWHPLPSFVGSMRWRLANEEVAPRVYEAFSLALNQYFEDYPHILTHIERKVVHRDETLRRRSRPKTTR